jgi:hypothetical protein
MIATPPKENQLPESYVESALRHFEDAKLLADGGGVDGAGLLMPLSGPSIWSSARSFTRRNIQKQRQGSLKRSV